MQAILFDLEGTLVDFQWDLRGAVTEVERLLVGLGFDPSAWERHYAALRNNAVLLAAQRGLDKRDVARAIDVVYDRYDLDAASRWSLAPDAKTVLAFLKDERHVKLGLVTNIGRQAVELGATRLGLKGLFDVVITRNDVELVKPCGEGIRIALAHLAAKNADALFVGDSVSDVLAARDGGIRVAFVQGGESAPASLNAASPDYLWQSLGELKRLYSGGELIA
ncbi:MAG: HAD family hydrolase [Chloroflexi bacterium]|nr:HAD family hydrolase [Chloroflexota bacterium]